MKIKNIKLVNLIMDIFYWKFKIYIYIYFIKYIMSSNNSKEDAFKKPIPGSPKTKAALAMNSIISDIAKRGIDYSIPNIIASEAMEKEKIEIKAIELNNIFKDFEQQTCKKGFISLIDEFNKKQDYKRFTRFTINFRKDYFGSNKLFTNNLKNLEVNLHSIRRSNLSLY